MSSFFYLQAEKTQKNREFIDSISQYCEQKKTQAYLISQPLGDNKYSYAYKDALVLLIPKHKILFVNFSEDEESFEEYVEDFIEDLGSISDKYRYKNSIGRPKAWRKDLIEELSYQRDFNAEYFLKSIEIEPPTRQRVCELLISLLTGSINDIDKVGVEIPQTILDKVKQKILLFDGDQTRFVYQQPTKPSIRIQGLSGTGKTELLLHKLKEIYLSFPECKIAFTCHNKILADSLKRRIPEFFDFMKVEQQIQWDERLWCTHAWGSLSDQNSGIYRYICEKYKIPFERYSRYMSFDKACKLALAHLENNPPAFFAFDFCLIDESQDFPDSFFQLCRKVTESTVYIAGDVFQSIFDENITFAIEPDFLLTKCYRTDPKTLMFAHSVGMGLFEPKKLRWLEDPEWAACGYVVEKDAAQGNYRLSREPLRRFEDVDRDDVPSVLINKTSGPFIQGATDQILYCINQIRRENPTATADDIGIILLDTNDVAFTLADTVKVRVPRELGWKVNVAYETKRKIKDTLFVSNKNNVKGLEFPFVICVTTRIKNSYSYRNSIYMTLTRSFIQTYLVVSGEATANVMPAIEAGLENINKTGCIDVHVPTLAEKTIISATIKYSAESESFFDMAHRIFEELEVLPIYRENLLDAVKKLFSEDFEYDRLHEAIEFNAKIMQGE
nr:ATP-binding domain-containing protein [uncultured Albidiferax sp.]